MNRTTVSLSPQHAATLRELAAALGLYLPRPLESRMGNLSALLAALAQAYQRAPAATQVAMTGVLDRASPVNNGAEAGK